MTDDEIRRYLTSGIDRIPAGPRPVPNHELDRWRRVWSNMSYWRRERALMAADRKHLGMAP